MLVSLVLAAGLAVLQLYPLAGLAAVIGFAAALIAWLRTLERRDGVPLTAGRRLGRAPYVRSDCGDSAQQLERLGHSLQASLEQVDGDWEDRDRTRACIEDGLSKMRGAEPSQAMRMLAVAARLLAQRTAEMESRY
jgi:hypothetical protein